MSDTPAPIFTAEKLKAEVARYFAPVPAHHVHAQIEYRVGGTLRVEVASRINDHWEVQGSLAWNLRTGKVDEGSIRIAGSWA